MTSASNNDNHNPPKRSSARGGRIRRFFAGVEGNSIVTAAPLLPLVQIWRWIWPYVRPVRRYLFASVALSLAVPLIEAARLYMLKITVDEVLLPKDLDPLIWISAVTIALLLVGGTVAFWDSYLGVWVGQSFILAMRTDFFRHLQGLSLDFFERRRLGDVLARLTSDIRAIESFVLAGINNALGASFKIVIFAGMMLYLDWQLALVALVVTPFFGLVLRWLTVRVKRASREKQRRIGALTALAEESLSNVALVQAYNRQQLEIERFHRESEGAFTASMVSTRLKSLVSPMVDFVQGVSALAVLALGTLALRDGRLSVGGLLVFIAYLSQLYTPVRQLAAQYNTVAGATAGAERVIEFFEHGPTVVEAPNAIPLPPGRGAVEFDAVSFRYPSVESFAVEDFSLRVEPGETVALVGHSGAGKSTVTKLLLRFYDVEAGAVRIDGHDVRDLQVESLRDSISVLMQETLIFEGTIRDNIKYGRPDASDEDIVRAAQAADAHDFVSGLPDGYDTLVGQKGRRLSGGQRQRIAIARAMVREAPILVLDEPTTGLDAEAGDRILGPLENLMSNRTTLVISHNLVTAGRADRIIVMENGRIVEEGTPAELTAQDGAYSRLRRLHDAGLAVTATR